METNPSTNIMDNAKPMDVVNPMSTHDEEAGSQVDVQEGATTLRRVYTVWTGQWSPSLFPTMSPLVFELPLFADYFLSSLGLSSPHDGKLDLQHCPLQHSL